MINKIKPKDILTLINEFVTYRGNKVIVINNKEKELIDGLKEMSFSPKSINVTNKEELFKLEEEINIDNYYISLIIIYNIKFINFKDLLRFANLISKIKVEYIVVTKLNKSDTENIKAFLIFYEPYRILGNALLLRRLT